jgi:hypothetical protein
VKLAWAARPVHLSSRLFEGVKAVFGGQLIEGEVSTVGEVTSRERLGDLLRCYYRAA